MTAHRLFIRCVLAFWFTLLPGYAISAGTASAPVILVLGDSLSAGHGVSVDATWVALLQNRLASAGYGYRVVNASVSGETTGGALARLPRALSLHKPAIVVIELGGNDGLRGLPLKQVRANFQTMIEDVQRSGARVVLVAMRIPVNYGAGYAGQFQSLYKQLAQQYSLPMVTDFIESVALDATMMQADGIHPNARAQPVLLEAVWPTLEPLLEK
ncbi:MAG TPA: arylesterase [Povalibacter sp.]|jgi:acyl-CoA thioesterase-1|nr:arylesterase [Povalibacter sp.]